MSQARPQVVIVGAGFGGLAAAQALRRRRVDVTMIDQRNHHLFQPLLYQVATAALSPADIAAPIRSILANNRNTRVLLDRVEGVDTADEPGAARLAARALAYDWLILATGARHSYFGRDDWAAHAPGHQDDRRRDRGPPQGAARARAGRDRDATRRARKALAHLRRDRRRPDRRRDGRRDRRARPQIGLARFPLDHPALLARDPDRRRPAPARRLPRNAVGQGEAGDRGARRRGHARMPRSRRSPPIMSSSATSASPRFTAIWAAGVQASPAAEWLGADATAPAASWSARICASPATRTSSSIGDTAALADSRLCPASPPSPSSRAATSRP